MGVRRLHRASIGCLLLVSLAGGMGGFAFADDGPSGSADVGFLTKYVWRGFELSKDSIVVQPSATVALGNLSVNFWGNVDLDPYTGDGGGNDATKWNETDLTIDYGWSAGATKLDAGMVYYALDGIEDTQELFFGASWDVLLSPSVTLYRDIEALKGWYLQVDAGHSFELSDKLSLDVAGSLSYWSVDDPIDGVGDYSELHNAVLSTQLNVPLGGRWSLAPMVAYSTAISNTAETWIRISSFSDDDAFLWGGVILSMTD